MSSEVFETREDDFQNLYQDLKRRTHELIPKLYGEEKKKQIRDAERLVEEATILIHEMEDESKKAPQPFRTQMASRIRKYRGDVEQITSALRRTQNSMNARNQLLFSPVDDDVDDFESVSQSQRSRLLHGSEILNRTTETISRTHQVAAETDAIGHDIIDELGTQREQLERTSDRLHHTGAELSRSRKILKGMARKVMTDKVILMFIIFLELAVLGGVIYWKFIS